MALNHVTDLCVSACMDVQMMLRVAVNGPVALRCNDYY